MEIFSERKAIHFLRKNVCCEWIEIVSIRLNMCNFVEHLLDILRPGTSITIYQAVWTSWSQGGERDSTIFL